jgi:hypothetical protein
MVDTHAIPKAKMVGVSGMSSDGTDRLTIHLNGAKHTVPNTVETEADILRAVDLDPAGYRLYRDAGVETLGPEQLVGEPGQTHLSDPVVVSEGDEFVAIPRGCHNA